MWLNKMKCMLVMYMEEKKEGEMKEELRVRKSISFSFSFIKISSCLCFMRPLIPQAKVASKNLGFCPKRGETMAKFSKIMCGKFQPLILI